MIFDNGINLIILESPSDSMLDRIEIICPKSIYSKNIFNESKPTVILYLQNGVYELITLQKIDQNNNLYIKKYFMFKDLEQYSPILLKRLLVIKDLFNNECKKNKFAKQIHIYRK